MRQDYCDGAFEPLESRSRCVAAALARTAFDPLQNFVVEARAGMRFSSIATTSNGSAKVPGDLNAAMDFARVRRSKGKESPRVAVATLGQALPNIGNNDAGQTGIRESLG